MAVEKSDIAVQIEQEHECLKRDMGDIKEDMMQDVTADNFRNWRLEFMWRLRDFKNHLSKHFDVEEEGGFMNEILTEAPEALNQVKKLEAEHTHVLAALDEILDDLKVMEVKDLPNVADIRNRVSGVISTIRAHEAAENDLIQTVYCQEYGYPAS
ncbi:hypothetical protein GWO43_29795 [candidate division KSB1 bacterium]|nr:hypothetical protein [candidate division KSB1 bacterium]NIR72218.1 hypothetical protein [candidate division KSB1 bacterium]NIS28098.1 hypothetical protein [candidate division KSB1 bacterium]NIT74978.1 hypothetical protein [candidate division KSB1 bacterium]NIU28782.1 hypothetical protein [candidate division KSB1 bacterium]